MQPGLDHAIGSRLWHFPGGVRLRHWKKMSIGDSVESAGVPGQLVLPLNQSIGAATEAIVTTGQQVARYQRLTKVTGGVCVPLHAPTSGTIVHAGNVRTPHGEQEVPGLILEPDGRDEGDGLPPMADWPAQPAEPLRLRLRDAGVVGLGGALFPTHSKLRESGATAKVLIINGAECEPYISCDEMLMRLRPEQIVTGARILARILGATQTIIAIEDQMGAVESRLRDALADVDAEENQTQIIKVPTIYPEGGEKQLIRVLTGLEVPSGGIPLDIGIVTQNVATAAACYQAVVHGRPLVSRIVTVTGRGVQSPCNLEALIGTPIAHLVERAGGYSDNVARLVMGGPMMGTALPDDELPVTKGSNCVLALLEKDVRRPAPELPCIRCGECARVCPARLLPQQLLWYIQAGDFEQTRQHHLSDCIECGCCAQVCPSQIPLVDYYRFGKTEIAVQDRQQLFAEQARARFEAHEQRRAQREAEFHAQLTDRQGRLTEDARQAEIRAAIERVRARRRPDEDAES